MCPYADELTEDHDRHSLGTETNEFLNCPSEEDQVDGEVERGTVHNNGECVHPGDNLIKAGESDGGGKTHQNGESNDVDHESEQIRAADESGWQSGDAYDWEHIYSPDRPEVEPEGMEWTSDGEAERQDMDAGAADHDLYTLLGVGQSATNEEIKKAYRTKGMVPRVRRLKIE